MNGGPSHSDQYAAAYIITITAEGGTSHVLRVMSIDGFNNIVGFAVLGGTLPPTGSHAVTALGVPFTAAASPTMPTLSKVCFTPGTLIYTSAGLRPVDTHQIIEAEGLPNESCQPFDATTEALSDGLREELFTLMPGLCAQSMGDLGGPARRNRRDADSRVLRERSTTAFRTVSQIQSRAAGAGRGCKLDEPLSDAP